ncbi:MAG: DNA polymerase III subunit delta [Planctomycetota bacterium]
MAKVPALQFDAHLQKQGVQSLYVFEGEDDALLTSCLSALKNSIETPDMPGSMTTDIDEVEDCRQVFDELHTQPFIGMSGKRLVIVREGKDFISEHKAPLQDYLGNPSPSGILALCCDKLDKRYKAAKMLGQKGVIVDCTKIRWKEARRWISNQTAQEGKKMSGRALSMLLEAVGPDITTLQAELDKLVLYVGEKEMITEQHVEDLVPQSRSRSIFDLSNAITQGNVGQALELGQNLLLEGEKPTGIVTFLAHRIRQLWRIRRMVEEGKQPNDISREVGMPRWAAKKASRSVKQLSERWFARRIGMLARADVELKSTSIQSREEEVWLSRFLTQLCQH